MAGEGLRIGLSEFGEGIARGMRSKTASWERGIWHLESLRRKAEEDDRQEDLRKKRLKEEREYKDFRDNRSSALRGLNDALEFARKNFSDNPEYLSIQDDIISRRESLMRGDTDPIEARVPESFVSAMRVRQRKIAERERYEFERRYPAPDTTDEGGNYYIIWNDQTEDWDITDKKGRDSMLKEIDREKKYSKDDPYAIIDLDKRGRRLINAPVFGSREEALREAGKRSMVNYRRGFSEATGGIDVFADKGLRDNVPAGTGATTPVKAKPLSFKQQLAEADADTQKRYESLNDSNKKIFKELVEMGEDLEDLMGALPDITGSKSKTKRKPTERKFLRGEHATGRD